MSLKFKRHCPLLVLLMLVMVALVLSMGDQRIVAYDVQDNAQVMKQNIYLAQAEIFSVLGTLGGH
ncbi:MAG: hypothetical protein HZB51_03415 [Chloroflexi bacterium]|nr:hypothetical protein [Chloroflexota bacterium]